MNPKLFRPLVYTLVIFQFSACSTSEKSELARRLEGIFYDGKFASTPDQTFNAADYGAVGDKVTLNTTFIQAAIDAAEESGGGRVIFPRGIYLTGAIFLKSNVDLHLDEGVIIRAVQDDSQYPERPTRIAGIEMDWPAALINIYEQKNVRITGKGIIDGNGKYWWDKFWGDPPRSGGMWEEYKEMDVRWAVDYDCKRVRPVVVYKCEDVLLKDFTVQRAGFWTVSLTYSSRVYVDGLTIRNNIGGFGPSSDGINTDSSRDVLVENCDIDCNDDNLCIKSGRDADGLRVNRPAENIVYRNCITRAGHGLFTIGSETSGGMRNIEVYGLEAIGTNTGIRFKSAQVRGGLIENIWFHDIRMIDVNSPFHFELNWYPEYSYPKIPDHIPEEKISERWKILTQPVVPPERGIPEFRNIRLSDISVKGAQQAIYANAFPEKPMSHFEWKNIKIASEEYGSISHAADWDFVDVVINTTSKDPLDVKNGANINFPGVPLNDIAWGENLDSGDKNEDKIDQLISENSNGALMVFDVENQRLIQQEDTVGVFDEVAVHTNFNNGQFRFFEPLGDGFYFSPVSINVVSDSGVIEVSGQKTHNWYFRVSMNESPKEISGAEEWSYDLLKKEVRIKKTGKVFTLSIQK
jgi:hypothetical protein